MMSRVSHVNKDSSLRNTYGTARFKLVARVRVTRVYFIAPLKYFSNSCVSVGGPYFTDRTSYTKIRTGPHFSTY